VILLHALFATATSWYRTVGALSARHRSYAVDLVGDPNPSRPTRPITSEADYVRWVTEVADGLGVSRFDLVGNSLGGFVAAASAMELGDRVRRLVLLSPAATFHPMPAFYVHMFAPKLLALALPWLPGRARAMRRAVDWMRAGLPSDGPWDELFQQMLVHGKGTSRVFPRVFGREELARIVAPTLLLVGDHETIYPVDAVVRDARALMPGIQVQIVPGAHHVACVAQPEAVNARLLAFLESDPSTAAA
jgi:pimeloyl-ACP methyl ester carboxylesterase